MTDITAAEYRIAVKVAKECCDQSTVEYLERRAAKAEAEFVCPPYAHGFHECNTVPASSPVVPVPTETGPWQTLQEVPDDVTRVLDSESELWVQEGGQWFSICQLHNPAKYAPFVAAKEGDA